MSERESEEGPAESGAVPVEPGSTPVAEPARPGESPLEPPLDLPPDLAVGVLERRCGWRVC